MAKPTTTKPTLKSRHSCGAQGGEDESIAAQLREIRNMLDPKEFDIWGLIKRSNTTDPYIVMAKHRMNKNPTRRAKAGSRFVDRKRRKASAIGLSDTESIRSHTSTEIYEEGLGEDFDYDAEEEGHETKSGAYPCQVMYQRACRKYGVLPVTCFNNALKLDRCSLRHRALGDDIIKSISIALVGNSTIQTLDLSDNDLGPQGAEYLADALKENTFVTSLSLAENNLKVEGVQHIVNVVKTLDNLNSLDLSGNGIRECDSWVIRPLIEDTVNLKHLSLAHNQLRESAGEVIGEALLYNDTMESLDLSWNHLRRDGAVFVAEGVSENTCLRKLNVAWNGFYLDGCKAMARALEENKTLTELDMTCNRISKECLDKLMMGLKRNNTLEVIRLGWNPITPLGAMSLLQFINEHRNSAIKSLDLTDQLVEPDFVALLGEIEASRELKVVYGQVKGQDKRGDDDDERQLMDENPIIVLMEFGKLMGFRLMDLFAALDKDGSKSLDHHEIRTGLRHERKMRLKLTQLPLYLRAALDKDGSKSQDHHEIRTRLRMVNIPLSDKCIEILITKLDVDGDGEIDFGELMAAQTEHRRKMSKFYAAQDHDVDIEDTEIGRVRIKLSRLMAKQMSGNPAFKRSVEMMQSQIRSGGLSILQDKMSAKLQKGSKSRPSSASQQRRTSILPGDPLLGDNNKGVGRSRRDAMMLEPIGSTARLASLVEDEVQVDGCDSKEVQIDSKDSKEVQIDSKGSKEKGWKPLSTT